MPTRDRSGGSSRFPTVSGVPWLVVDQVPGPEVQGRRPNIHRLGPTLLREARLLRRSVRRPQLLGDEARRLVSPRVAFLETNSDPGRSLLLVGSGRSGTTWVSEIFVDALHCRLVYEPLRTRSVPWTWPVRPGHYLDPDDDSDPALAAVIDRILTGRVRTAFTDKYNAVRFPGYRLVKEVRATNLLPWIVRRYPRTPVVLLLRHPVPTAWSVVQLGWPGKLDDFLGQDRLMDGPLAPFRPLVAEAAASPDPFHRMVLQWCLENFVPTRLLGSDEAHVVFYENMVDDPGGELERLRLYLGRFPSAPWDVRMASVTALQRPSHSKKRGTDVTSGPRRLDDWVDQIAPDRVEAALALVAGFGLDRLYHRSSRPLLSPDEVLSGP